MWMNILKKPITFGDHENTSSEFWLYDPALSSTEIIDRIYTPKEKVVFDIKDKANGFPFDIDKFTDLAWEQIKREEPKHYKREWREAKVGKEAAREKIIQTFLKKYTVIVIGATENDWREVLEFLNRYQLNPWNELLWGTIFAWPYPQDKLKFSSNHDWIIDKVYYVDIDRRLDRRLWQSAKVGDSPENMHWWKNE